MMETRNTPAPQSMLSPDQVTRETFPIWMKGHLESLEWKPHKRLTRETLQESFRLARQFMLNNQKPEGISTISTIS